MFKQESQLCQKTTHVNTVNLSQEVNSVKKVNFSWKSTLD